MTTTSRLATCYFLVAAPGHYGDRSTVLSSHRTLAAAIRAARAAHAASKLGVRTVRRYVVRCGNLRRGDEWLRSSEAIYPIAGAKEVTL